MAQESSIKVTPGKAKQLESAVKLIREHYGAVLAVWRELPDEQRRRLLEHSPMLARLLDGIV